MKCILCNTDDAGLFLKENGLTALKCRRCGLVYVSPMPPFAEIKEKYSNSPSTAIDKEISAIGEKTLKAQLDLALIKKFKKNGRVLDIGCAEGAFLSQAAESGYDPYGIEINKASVKYAKDKYHLINIFEGGILESDFPKEYFDIISMRNVLSHLRNPVQELNKLNTFLKEDGLFFCITGNLGSLSRERIKQYYNFSTPHLSEHLFHYSEKNIYTLFKMSSFSINKIYRFLSYLDECNGLFLRIIRCLLNDKLSMKVLAFVRLLLGGLCFKKGRWLSLAIIAFKEK